MEQLPPYYFTVIINSIQSLHFSGEIDPFWGETFVGPEKLKKKAFLHKEFNHGNLAKGFCFCRWVATYPKVINMEQLPPYYFTLIVDSIQSLHFSGEIDPFWGETFVGPEKFKKMHFHIKNLITEILPKVFVFQMGCNKPRSYEHGIYSKKVYSSAVTIWNHVYPNISVLVGFIIPRPLNGIVPLLYMPLYMEHMLTFHRCSNLRLRWQQQTASPKDPEAGTGSDRRSSELRGEPTRTGGSLSRGHWDYHRGIWSCQDGKLAWGQTLLCECFFVSNHGIYYR